ncbi:hypothetical protein KJ586_00060 [Patescibacteria group bacterium]|nr:hypothetical protein [Patescibacteria group bacterium]MBU4454899.1 hypothetical protein [Patescibacteria group bacterium]
MFKYQKEIPDIFYAGGIIFNPKDKTFLLLFRGGNTKAVTLLYQSTNLKNTKFVRVPTMILNYFLENKIKA